MSIHRKANQSKSNIRDECFVFSGCYMIYDSFSVSLVYTVSSDNICQKVNSNAIIVVVSRPKCRYSRHEHSSGRLTIAFFVWHSMISLDLVGFHCFFLLLLSLSTVIWSCHLKILNRMSVQISATYTWRQHSLCSRKPSWGWKMHDFDVLTGIWTLNLSMNICVVSLLVYSSNWHQFFSFYSSSFLLT